MNPHTQNNFQHEPIGNLEGEEDGGEGLAKRYYTKPKLVLT